MNAWDDEFKKCMLHSENHCNKFMMDHIEWSSAIGIWLSRYWLLHPVHLWMFGTGCPDPQNMFQECFWLHIQDNCTFTIGSVGAQIMVTEQEIKRLLKDAPALRCQHLLDLIQDAKTHDNMTRAKAILEILKREEQKKQWWQINCFTRPPVEETPPQYRSRPQLALSGTILKMKSLITRWSIYQNNFG
jgi:hypothetical protein